jgi:hypothetical protein
MTDQPVRFAERYQNREQARKIYGAMADEYGRLQFVGDALADAFVAECTEGRLPMHKLLGQALEHGIDSVTDAPQSLIDLFEELDQVPGWADFELMDLGALTYQRLGPAAMIILSSWSLMNGYRCGPAVKPLMATGALARMAPRRLAETSRFVTEVCQVGGMRRHARGFTTSARVRIMHALVRRKLSRSPDWCTEAWGSPINQGDMAGTVIEFSLLVLAGARRLGFHFSREEAEAVIHLWRYCGYVNGVDRRLLRHFASEEQGVRFAEMVNAVQPGADDDSRALAAALRAVPMQMATSPMQKRLSRFVTKYHDGLTRAFNGDEIADALEIPNPRWKHSIHPTRVVVRSMELARRALPGGTRLAQRLGNRAVRADVNRMLAGVEPAFRVSD